MKHLCSHLFLIAWASSISILCFGQTAPTFTTESSASGPTPFHVYAVDVNNDGLTDIIQDSAQPASTGSYFAVSINLGNGTFAPPVTYYINSVNRPLLTWGDFNKDGNVDIAFVLPRSRQVFVYPGNGDGTFGSPINTTIDLPSGLNFSGSGLSSIVAADFNKDGNVDLVAAVFDGDDFGGTWAVYLLEGDGTGSFNNPTPIYYPTSGWTVQHIVVGDFDTDNNADVGVLEEMTCSGGSGYCWSNVVALFGDGGMNFQPVDVTYVNQRMTLGASDLNNDGTTDLYGIQYPTDGGRPQLAVFPGYYGRVFSYYFTPIPSSAPNVGVLSTAADFSGTGTWALAGLSRLFTNGSENDQMVYFLNAGTPNVSIVTGPMPQGASGWQSDPVVGNFNGDTKPDIAVVESAAINSLTSTLAAGLNSGSQGFYSTCNYPSSGEGINVCGPTSADGGTFNISATANSFGQLRKIELWLDGTKIGEDHWVWGQSAFFNLNFPNPSSGTHNATFFAADVDNRLQRYDFTFTTP